MEGLLVDTRYSLKARRFLKTSVGKIIVQRKKEKSVKRKVKVDNKKDPKTNRKGRNRNNNNIILEKTIPSDRTERRLFVKPFFLPLTAQYSFTSKSCNVIFPAYMNKPS